MTTAYDPLHPSYLDEADVRGELTRVFDVCHGCRRCTSLCTTFPTLFEMLGRVPDGDAGRMTPAQQNDVVSECHQCTLCAVGCPFGPGEHDLAIDFPRLMLRSKAMMRTAGQVGTRERIAAQIIGRADRVGRIATVIAPSVNRLTQAEPGGAVRRLLRVVTGISSERPLPTFSNRRFSTWFERRPKVRIGRRHGKVALFPTCLVEYQQPAIGYDLVKVYERNGVEVSLPRAVCCGAPWLHAGDLRRFTAAAEHNIAVLADQVRRGNDIVVPQPTCSFVLKRDYVDYAPGSDAELVAEHTYDSAEYLMKLHRSGDTPLDTVFGGDVPATITYHSSCHLRAQGIGLKSRDLMRLTGATIRLVQQCSGVDGLLGLSARHDDGASPLAAKLALAIDRLDSDVVAGDCHLSNTAIAERCGTVPLHPMQVMARAYGIAAEETR
jgi:glycerol-3-phosphate dehydrogenase subunit C